MHKVFINSLPKSGTNLLAKTFDLLGYKLCGTLVSSGFVGKSLLSRVRRLMSFSLKSGYIIGVDCPIEVKKSMVERRLKKAGENSYIFAHVCYTDDLLNKIIELDFKPLVIIRDPRAVVNSWVHYVSQRENHVFHKYMAKLSYEERFYIALHGYSNEEMSLQSCKTRCRALDSWIKNVNVLSIKFEDLVGREGGGSERKQVETLKTVFNFVGIPCENIQRVAADLFGPGRQSFRIGHIDSWKQEIPAAILEEIERDLRDVLIEWGYI